LVNFLFGPAAAPEDSRQNIPLQSLSTLMQAFYGVVEFSFRFAGGSVSYEEHDAASGLQPTRAICLAACVSRNSSAVNVFLSKNYASANLPGY
jgi:hypothetical protein